MGVGGMSGRNPSGRRVTEPASDDASPPGRRRRGRPRSEEADRNILRAATEVLARQGLGGMSIEEVATRAGVGKATIYRRWSSKGALALDAFLADAAEMLPAPDTGSFRGDLLHALGAWVHSATTTSAGTTLAELVAEVQRDPELAADWRKRVVFPIRGRYRVIFERAVSRGDIAADVDTDVVLDMVFGAGLYRLLNRHLPLDLDFVAAVVELTSAGLGVPPTLSHGAAQLASA
ncbi:MAG TPA: TetR/AcrR family transcriptional regulator [Streptosporangiaceae bacterium]|nr:TetR/AcrR family transcriptional regulator [Streptosporangiaceae bacterium]